MPDLLTVENTQILAEQPESSVLVESAEVVQVVAAGVQGPPGPPGTSGASSFQVNASAALGGHRAVILSETGAVYADNMSLSHSGRVSGITTGSAASGQPVSIQSAGKITEPSWSWTPGNDIWLGTNGQLTQTFPVAPVFTQRLGYAISATEMWIEIIPPIIH